uniref:formaldehyde-activating enzyme n=1 Tax=Zavarzinella formosa TaxID=360055 RepID=UPI00036A7124
NQFRHPAQDQPLSSPGTIPKDACGNLVIVCHVFVAPEAANKDKLFHNNYEATKLALKRAWAGEPTLDEALQFRKKMP